jgi:hypothetical protein
MLMRSDGKPSASGSGVARAIQPPFDPAQRRQWFDLRIVQHLPRPRQNAGVVAGDVQMEILQVLPEAVAIKIPARPGPEQRRERLFTPARNAACTASARSVCGGNGYSKNSSRYPRSSAPSGVSGRSGNGSASGSASGTGSVALKGSARMT